MKDQDIRKLFSSFTDKNILIIGDSMIDAYMWGSVNRMSPEAPVPVVEISKHENRLGGAANVAMNIKSLGARPILCSIIGDDIRGKELINLMKEENLCIDAIYTSNNRKTTIKTRIISEGKHQLRVDEEETNPILIQEEENILKIAQSHISSKIDAIILQDYNKGLLTKRIIKEIISIAKSKNIYVIVDPKKDNFLEYIGCDMFKPNLKEIKEGMKINFDEDNQEELKNVTDSLRNILKSRNILLTLSSKGLCINSDKGFIHSPSYGGHVIDVSGAGDTVISVASLLLSSNVDFKDISKISSIAGGIVCQKVGVVTLDIKDLLKSTLETYK